MVRALVCGTRGRWFESTLLYQKMVKDKKTKPSKELPLGFVDRQEKELLIRDFVISKIKEVMIKYGFQYLSKHQASSIQTVLENFYLIKIDLTLASFHLKMKINGYLLDMILPLH